MFDWVSSTLLTKPDKWAAWVVGKQYVPLRGFLIINSVILTYPQLIFWPFLKQYLVKPICIAPRTQLKIYDDKHKHQLFSQKVPSQLSDWVLYTQSSSKGLCDFQICKQLEKKKKKKDRKNRKKAWKKKTNKKTTHLKTRCGISNKFSCMIKCNKTFILLP